MQDKDFQHDTVDLYDNIRKGNNPSWDLYIQLLKSTDFYKLDFSPVDTNKVCLEGIVPLQFLGNDLE
nr:catalase [Bacteroidetes bacterium endosymbiont of Geopemphigus sp.]